jgi:serine/threonine protein kinase
MAIKQLSIIRESTDWLVWRGVDAVSHKRFTIKQVNPKANQPEYLSEQLRAECTFFENLSHPGVLSQPQWEENGPRILFEDTQGSLAQLLEQHGSFTAEHVANVLLQCAEALEYLHGRNLGHGSVNTQSILIAPNGKIKFGDFTGYRFDETPPSMSPDQKPRYLAPEQLNTFLGRCSPSSDLYCLGYIALEMLTGPAFEQLFILDSKKQKSQSVNWLGWHMDVNKELPELHERLTTVEALILVIAGLVEKKIDERAYKSASALIRVLKDHKLTSTQTLPSLRGPVEERSESFPPRRKKTAIRLEVLEGDKLVKHRFGPTQGVVVGRDSACDFVLDHASVSRRHAFLAAHSDGSWWVYDLKSTSGTFVQKEKLVEPRLLNNGDMIHFGRVNCRVVLPTSKSSSGDNAFMTIGPIRIHQQVHKGSNGDLYIGEITRKGKSHSVAVRVFPKPFTFDRDQLHRFVRGVSAAAKFNHPNIVRLFRAGRMPKRQQWYLAMEYLSGKSLRDRLKDGKPMPLLDVMKMAHDLLAGLMAIEKEHLFHRNITPSCVLFNAQNTAKLSDFVLMREEDLETTYQITRAGMLPGDKVYQPPELLFGGTLCPATDLYSIGAVLYEALTGIPPFARTLNLPELLSAIRTTTPPPPRKHNPVIPPAMETIVLQALERAPENRYARALDMDRALRAITGL